MQDEISAAVEEATRELARRGAAVEEVLPSTDLHPEAYGFSVQGPMSAGRPGRTLVAQAGKRQRGTGMGSKEQNHAMTWETDPAGQDPIGQVHPEGDREDHEVLGGGAAVMGSREERTWSVLAHLSAFLNIFTLFLGPVAALVVWLVYRDRSRKVAFEALQSAAYQGAWLAVLGIGWSLTILLTFVLVGFLLVPAMMILTVVPFAHMGYAAYRVSKDGEYRYPIVADLIENR